MSPREYCKAVGGGLALAIFWSVFVLILTGQYHDFIPEPARPEYSRMENSAADLAAAKIAAGGQTLVKPMSPGTNGLVAQAETTGQRRIAPSLSIFGKSGRQPNILDAISGADPNSKQ